jgi:hypothetical protein
MSNDSEMPLLLRLNSIIDGNAEAVPCHGQRSGNVNDCMPS